MEFWKFALLAVNPDDEAVTAPPATLNEVDALSEPTVEEPIRAEEIVAEDVAVIVPAVSEPTVAFDAVSVPVAASEAVFTPPYKLALDVAVNDPIVAV